MELHLKKALAAFSEGSLLIVTDDHDRENEGDLIMLAEYATAEKTAFMVRHTTGILCVAITAEKAYRLRLPYMVELNEDQRGTAFTVTVDLAEGTTTGVSAAERSATIRALASDQTKPVDLVRPGHIFPLIAHKDGLSARAGHTEAGIALAQLTGKYPAALLSEIVAADGSMARGEELKKFSVEHSIPIISIKEILQLVKEGELTPIENSYLSHKFDWAELQLPNQSWKIATFPSLKHREHVVLEFKENEKFKSGQTPLVRIHSECFTGDVLHSRRCDCGEQLAKSIELIEKSGYGYVIYLRDHEGRGIGLSEKLRAYNLQSAGLDTIEANLELGFPVDLRDWTEATLILKNLGLKEVVLLSNNPDKVKAVNDGGIVCHQSNLVIESNEFNDLYIKTKIKKLGHVISTIKGDVQ
jgi:3,4-dihydroxy 2-butanone 4-phosphate synthase / GTP cyclohydrolase II